MTIQSLPSTPASSKSANGMAGKGAVDDLISQMGDLFSAFLALLSDTARTMQDGDQSLNGEQNSGGDIATQTNSSAVADFANIDDATKSLLEAFISEGETDPRVQTPELAQQVKINLPPALQKFLVDAPLLDRQPQLKLMPDASHAPENESLQSALSAIIDRANGITTHPNNAPETSSSNPISERSINTEAAAFNATHGSNSASDDFTGSEQEDADTKNSPIFLNKPGFLAEPDLRADTGESHSANLGISATTPKSDLRIETISMPVNSTFAGKAAPVHEQVAMVVSSLRGGPDGEHRIVLRLTPESLGTVHIRVEMHAGEIDIHMHAENSATENMLHKSMPDLRQEIEALGLRTGSFDVQTGDAQQFAKQFAHAPRSNNPLLKEEEVLHELRNLAQHLGSTTDLDIRL